MRSRAPYLTGSVSNGNPREQALIRRWWHEKQGARGRMVWEYCLGDLYADGVWFPDAPELGCEEPGRGATNRFPLSGRTVVLCEAKIKLTPELIGQALVYRVLARRAGARVQESVIFAEKGSAVMSETARELGLTLVLRKLECDLKA